LEQVIEDSGGEKAEDFLWGVQLDQWNWRGEKNGVGWREKGEPNKLRRNGKR